MSKRISALEGALALKQDNLEKVKAEYGKLAKEKVLLLAEINTLNNLRKDEMKLINQTNTNVLAQIDEMKTELELVQIENRKLMAEKVSFSNRVKRIMDDLKSLDGSKTTIELLETTNVQMSHRWSMRSVRLKKFERQWTQWTVDRYHSIRSDDRKKSLVSFR